MRKQMKYLMGIAAVVLLIAAGTILPGELARRRDRLILGQIYSEPLEAAELSDYLNISMVDKASLLGQMTGTSQPVRLNTGAIYDQDTIRVKFSDELEKLHELRFFPLSPAGEMNIVRSTTVTLYIQSDAPAINMILWEINIRIDSLNGVFYLDDQTGKILGFTFSAPSFDDWDYHEGLVKDWESYLGADIRNVRKSGQAEDSEENNGENIFFFALYSGSRSAGGWMSSDIQRGTAKTNRWSLSYSPI